MTQIRIYLNLSIYFVYFGAVVKIRKNEHFEPSRNHQNKHDCTKNEGEKDSNFKKIIFS